MDKPAADIDQCLRSVKRRFPEVNPLVLQVLLLMFVGVGVCVWGVWGVCECVCECVGVFVCLYLYVCVCMSVCV